MASNSSSSSSSMGFSHNQERLDLESVQELVASINQYMNELLVDSLAWRILKLKCTSKLSIRSHEFFEFSEQSVLSNLYWGIESIDAAVQANWPRERASRLKNAERLLQVPALVDEHGITAGIPNHHLVCCSYFYLSLVRKLQKDEWQVSMHFLQALLVSPELVYAEFVPNLCIKLLVSCFKYDPPADFDMNKASEPMRWMARRYKDWLMYYQVMSYGKTPQWHCSRRNIVSPKDEPKNYKNEMSRSRSPNSSSLYQGETSKSAYHNLEKVYPPDPPENIAEESTASISISKFQECKKSGKSLDQVYDEDIPKSSNSKCLHEMLQDPESDMQISYNSASTEESDSGDDADESQGSFQTIRTSTDDLQQKKNYLKEKAPCSLVSPEDALSELQAHQDPNGEAPGVDAQKFLSEKSSSSVNDVDLSVLELRDTESDSFWNCHLKGESLQLHEFRQLTCIDSTGLQNYQFFERHHHGIPAGRRNNSSKRSIKNEVYLNPRENFHTEQAGIIEQLISRLCFSEGLGVYVEEYSVQITTIYKMSNKKAGLKYSMLKDAILNQLLMAISTSKEERVIRTSVTILSSIISENTSVVDDVKKKGLQLCDLANALRRNVHEAAVLMYLISPSPAEIKTLELLPTLVEVACSSKWDKGSITPLLVTPPAASLMILENLVTALDSGTNNTHLAVISSPTVLTGLLEIPRNNNLEEFSSLAAILVRCMRFDGECRRYVSQITPVAPFLSLLRSDQRHAHIAVEFFYELFHMPRSLAVNILQRIPKEESENNATALLLIIQRSEAEKKLLAANLLLHLNMMEDPSNNVCEAEAVKILLELVQQEENSATQQLSASILSNLGGTYSWTGEANTIAWLAKKTGLTSQNHRHLIKNCDWSDQNLQDASIETWCSKIAKRIIILGDPVFQSLERGLKSKTKRVSRDCLTAIAWLGCELVKSPNNLRYAACEILLSAIEQHVHPGLELEERLLACLCIYNYASGSGMQKLIHFSEGVRESLRRLSNVTWMAEELLRVADYFQPNKWRISCVHTQILEIDQNHSGAVSSLIYYKGQLHSGHADGSIKIWDIQGQTATLVWKKKEHKKAVTCFSLFEPENCLLSGSTDKTIRVWKMACKGLECIEVIAAKEPIQSIDTSGELIFAITQIHKMKMFDASRKSKDLCKNKKVKCIRVTRGKVYIGCTDSSIQELSTTNNRQLEIRAPAKFWRMLSRPINSIVLYKDWLYGAGAVVEGSQLKEWRRHSKPQISLVPEKGANVIAMEAVEDFIYLNCSSSENTLQIWLRGTQQKVGRLSAGSKITSLITANDMVLCGTETGIIKGWIPL